MNKFQYRELHCTKQKIIDHNLPKPIPKHYAYRIEESDTELLKRGYKVNETGHFTSSGPDKLPGTKEVPHRLDGKNEPQYMMRHSDFPGRYDTTNTDLNISEVTDDKITQRMEDNLMESNNDYNDVE